MQLLVYADYVHQHRAEADLSHSISTTPGFVDIPYGIYSKTEFKSNSNNETLCFTSF
jgi:hypothetical protein